MIFPRGLAKKGTLKTGIGWRDVYFKLATDESGYILILGALGVVGLFLTFLMAPFIFIARILDELNAYGVIAVFCVLVIAVVLYQPMQKARRVRRKKMIFSIKKKQVEEITKVIISTQNFMNENVNVMPEADKVKFAQMIRDRKKDLKRFQ